MTSGIGFENTNVEFDPGVLEEESEDLSTALGRKVVVVCEE